VYLYFGYLFFNFLILLNKLLHENITTSAVLFSVAVIFIWSFIPFIGYLVAKILKANTKNNKYILLFLGFGIGLFERSLFYFDVLTHKQTFIGTIIVFLLFFLIAYLPTKSSNKES